jgi:hypothetical protein
LQRCAREPEDYVTCSSQKTGSFKYPIKEEQNLKKGVSFAA